MYTANEKLKASSNLPRRARKKLGYNSLKHPVILMRSVFKKESRQVLDGAGTWIVLYLGA